MEPATVFAIKQLIHKLLLQNDALLNVMPEDVSDNDALIRALREVANEIEEDGGF